VRTPSANLNIGWNDAINSSRPIYIGCIRTVSCADVRGRCTYHLSAIRVRTREPRKLDRAQANVIDKCRGDDAPECAFIEDRFDDAQ
jgi:hypothetical protein